MVIVKALSYMSNIVMVIVKALPYMANIVMVIVKALPYLANNSMVTSMAGHFTLHGMGDSASVPQSDVLSNDCPPPRPVLASS